MNTHIKITFITLTILFLLTPAVNAEFLPDWKKELSIGFDTSSGNTDKTELSTSLLVAREFDASRLSSKFNIFYSESDGVMDSQKWDSTTEYALDFGDNKEWFSIYKLIVDHDRFADIDYRILPSVGIGKWLAKKDDFEWSADVSVGYQITEFRSGAPEEEEATVIAHTFVKKQVFDNAWLSEDLSVIPELEEGNMRVKSETKFTNPIQENTDLEAKYIVDYDSDPSAGKKKTDTRFVLGVKHSF